MRKTKNTIELTEIQRQVIEGGLLGDGTLVRPVRRSKNSSFSYATKSEQHSEFVRKYFSGILTSTYVNYSKHMDIFDKRTEKFYSRWYWQTPAAGVFTELRTKWYPFGDKVVPKNIILNPLICLVWYLGDGYMSQKYKTSSTESLGLATNGFTVEEVNEVLIPQLSFVEAKVYLNKFGKPAIRIPRRKVEIFLDYIGNCPFQEYDYKWKVFPYIKDIWKYGLNKHYLQYETKILEYLKQGCDRYEIADSLSIPLDRVNYFFRKHKIDFVIPQYESNYFKSPGGEIYKVINNLEFSKTEKIDSRRLSDLVYRRRSEYKGWMLSNEYEFNLQQDL